MEVATTFFLSPGDFLETSSRRRPQDIFRETPSRRLPGDVLKTSSKRRPQDFKAFFGRSTEPPRDNTWSFYLRTF